MEAFAGIVLLVIAMFVYAGFTAVTEKLDEIIERLTPPRHVHGPVPGRTARAARCPTTTYFVACGPEHAPPCALPASSANVADIDEAPGIKLRLVAHRHPIATASRGSDPAQAP
jgi:hypothetical protein